MTKTLSAQLCEICGLEYIKPKVVIDNSKCPNVDIKDFYLDFEKPENFVKLLELPITGISLGKYIISYCLPLGSNFTRGEILHSLINHIKNFVSINKDQPYLKMNVDNIKQSIRDYDGWVWG